jgi:hypothetical protein
VEDGNMSFKYGEHEKVLANRIGFLKQLGVPIDSFTPMGVGQEDAIAIVELHNKGRGSRAFGEAIPAEALITDHPEIVLGLCNADCPGAVVYDPEKKVLALAHLGWKPSVNSIARRTIEKMTQEAGSNPEHLIVWIGPGIKQGSYFVEQLAREQDCLLWRKFIKPVVTEDGERGYRIDLPGYNADQFKKAGVLPGNVTIDSIDTFLDKGYFSHRASSVNGRPVGRAATVAGLKIPIEGA